MTSICHRTKEGQHRQLTDRVTSIVIDAICVISPVDRVDRVPDRRRECTASARVRRDGRRRGVFEKAGVDHCRSSWRIEVEEAGGKGVPSRLAIFHGVLVARKGFQRRTVLPEAVLQTRDKGSPVPRFRRRETAAAKALAPLHLILASRECGRSRRRKESHEQTPSGCYAVSLFLPPSSPRRRKLG